MNAPNLVKLKWKCCEKQPPKHDDYFVVKYDNTKGGWFLSYYLTKEKKFLSLTTSFEWKERDPKPWRWAELPRISQDRSLFDLND